MRQTARAILLNRQSRCLLVQHNERNFADRGKWATVGGGIDGNEDHCSCLKRELSEEFGHSVLDKVVIGPKLHSNAWKDRIDHFYVVWFDGDDVRIEAPDEILQHRWFVPEEVDQLRLFFGFEGDLFREALKLSKQPFDGVL